jgi:large subunit ribosomal protein L32e
MIMVQKRIKPKFHRQYSQTRIAIKRNPNKWRRPDGMYSGQAMGFKFKGAVPQAGYGQPKAIRFKHPCGLYETLITHAAQLDAVNPKTHAVRLSATMGARKRIEIIKLANAKKIKVLNPTRVKRKIKQTKELAAKKTAKTEKAKTEEKKAEAKTATKTEVNVEKVETEKAPAKKEEKQ